MSTPVPSYSANDVSAARSTLAGGAAEAEGRFPLSASSVTSSGSVTSMEIVGARPAFCASTSGRLWEVTALIGGWDA